jgi:hypothetical protein
MDAAEYRKNCMKKAMEEGSYYGTKPEEKDTYYCKSGASGNIYKLTFDKHEGWACTCESGKYRGYCKHVAGLSVWATRKGIELPKVTQVAFTLGGRPIS